ncbi:MAG: sugar ABC transporter permease [Deltaproteobacteria bacterium]|jgi:D-xylose transport system permease protein
MEAMLDRVTVKTQSSQIDWKNYRREWIPVFVIILCALVFDAWSGGAFITPRNLSNLSRQVCVNLTLAVGMTLIILTSGIDLSVGSVLALSGMAAAISQVHWQWAQLGMTGAVLSFVLAVAVGGLSGATAGFAISRLKITPFIVTLGMMVIARGLTLIISGAQAVAPLGESLGKLSSDYLSPEASLGLLSTVGVVGVVVAIRQWFKKAETAQETFKTLFSVVALSLGGIFIFCNYRGIPYMVFISVLCALSGMFILKYTRFGRFIYAIGGNREAAELSGVPVVKTLWLTYFLMGCMAGLAGVMDSARVNGAVPSAGELGELDAIAAVVIGGTSLMGGAGTIGGTVLGVLIMGILNNGMSLVGVSEHYQKVFKGIVIILAVYLDLRSKKK